MTASQPAMQAVHSRQALIQESDRRWNQNAVSAASVLVVGAGNIGDPAAIALGRAGIGRIDVVDNDVVSLPNLSRGVTYGLNDVGLPKAEVLAARIEELCLGVRARGIVGDVRWDIGVARFRRYDVVLLATDDHHSRLHVNRYVHRFPGRTRAIVNAGISDLSFSVQTIIPDVTPCYACGLQLSPNELNSSHSCNGIVSKDERPPAATNGMDGMAAAALMAKEAVLICAGLSPSFAGRELRLDGAHGNSTVFETSRRRSCSEHQRARSDEVIELEYSSRTEIRALRRAVGKRLSVKPEDVTLSSPLLMITRAVCDCGAAQAVNRPQGAALDLACGSCGNADAEHFQPELAFDFSDDCDGRTLADCGVPDDQALEVYARGQRIYLLPTLDKE